MSATTMDTNSLDGEPMPVKPSPAKTMDDFFDTYRVHFKCRALRTNGMICGADLNLNADKNGKTRIDHRDLGHCHDGKEVRSWGVLLEDYIGFLFHAGYLREEHKAALGQIAIKSVLKISPHLRKQLPQSQQFIETVPVRQTTLVGKRSRTVVASDTDSDEPQQSDTLSIPIFEKSADAANDVHVERQAARIAEMQKLNGEQAKIIVEHVTKIKLQQAEIAEIKLAKDNISKVLESAKQDRKEFERQHQMEVARLERVIKDLRASTKAGKQEPPTPTVGSKTILTKTPAKTSVSPTAKTSVPPTVKTSVTPTDKTFVPPTAVMKQAPLDDEHSHMPTQASWSKVVGKHGKAATVKDANVVPLRPPAPKRQQIKRELSAEEVAMLLKTGRVQEGRQFTTVYISGLSPCRYDILKSLLFDTWKVSRNEVLNLDFIGKSVLEITVNKSYIEEFQQIIQRVKDSRDDASNILFVTEMDPLDPILVTHGQSAVERAQIAAKAYIKRLEHRLTRSLPMGHIRFIERELARAKKQETSGEFTRKDVVMTRPE